MKNLSLKTIAIIMLGAIVGCDGGGSNSPIPMEKACSEYTKAICDTLGRCELGIIAEIENHAPCQDSLDLCNEEFQRMVDSVNAGRLRYDGAQARTCLQRITSLTCTNVFWIFDDEIEECESVFTGLVAADGDCYFDKECATGLFCDESSSHCPGKCQPYAAVGASCLDKECDPETAECHDTVCVLLAGAGESCEDVSCAKDLNCDTSNSVPRCVAPGEEGSACASEDQCQSGLRCLNQKCSGPAAANETCVIDEFDEVFISCQTGFYCDADVIHQQHQGACKPKKGQGESCVLFYECQPQYLCIGTTISQNGQVTPGRCQPPVTEGGSCSILPGEGQLVECRYDLWCNPQTAKCEPLPGEGGTCNDDNRFECKNNDLYCDLSGSGSEGVCRAKKADNQPCHDGNECQSDRCEQGTCASRFECEP